MTHSTEPLEIKTEHGPSSKASWIPYELNLKYPITNTEQWTFTGTRFIAKEISPNNLLESDPWFRPFRKWCMDDKVWTKKEGRGPHDWIADSHDPDKMYFYRFTTVEGKHIMLWCE